MKQKFARRVIALALSFTLVLSLFVPMVVMADDDAVVVYQMATDEAIQSLAVGTRASGEGDNFVSASQYLHPAGGATFTVVENPLFDGSAIRVSGRTANHFAVDIHFSKAGFDLEPGVDYTLRVRVGVDGSFWLADTDAPHAVRAQATSGDGYMEATYTFQTSDFTAAQRGIRIAANAPAVSEYTIYEIVVAQGTSIPDELPPALVIDSGVVVDDEEDDDEEDDETTEGLDFNFPAGVVYSLLDDPNFQGLSIGADLDGNFVGFPYFTGASDFVVDVVPNPYGGNALRFTERAAEYAGLDFVRTDLLLDGDYLVQVVGNIELEDAFDPAAFVLTGTSSPYGWMGSEAFPDEATGDFITEVRAFSVVDGEIESENGAIGGNIRMRPTDVTNNYTIYQIIIVTAGTAIPALPSLGGGTTPGPTTEPGGPVVTALTGRTEMSLTVGSGTAMVNGTAVSVDPAPYISPESGRTLVPLRFITENFGAAVDWDEATRTITITHAGGEFTLVAGTDLGNGMGTPEVVDGRTFVPARYIAEQMEGYVTWDGETRTVRIVLGSGIMYRSVETGADYTGLNIRIGSGQDVWPFSAAPANGVTAFTPEQNATYRISVNLTNHFASTFRVRWSRDGGTYEAPPAADTAVVNDNTYNVNDVATVIPAYFNDGVEEGETYTLVIEITLDGSAQPEDLIGDIVIRAGQGSNDWTANWVTIEKDGVIVASWGI